MDQGQEGYFRGRDTRGDDAARQAQDEAKAQCATTPVTDAERRYTGPEAPRGVYRRGITLDNVEDVFSYHTPDAHQRRDGAIVQEAFIAVAKAILRHVPDSADRSSALRHLRLAKMEAAAAIALRGEV